MKITPEEQDVLAALALKPKIWRGLEFDWRPVYRWSHQFGCWVYKCSGRMVTTCCWTFQVPLDSDVTNLSNSGRFKNCP